MNIFNIYEMSSKAKLIIVKMSTTYGKGYDDDPCLCIWGCL